MQPYFRTVGVAGSEVCQEVEMVKGVWHECEGVAKVCPWLVWREMICYPRML